MTNFDTRQPCAFSKHCLECSCYSTTTEQIKKMKTKEENVTKSVQAKDNLWPLGPSSFDKAQFKCRPLKCMGESQFFKVDLTMTYLDGKGHTWHQYHVNLRSLNNIMQDSKGIQPQICYFISRYFPRGVFQTSQLKGIYFHNFFAEIFVKKLGSALQIKQTKNRRLNLIELFFLRFFLNHLLYETFPVTFMQKLKGENELCS